MGKGVFVILRTKQAILGICYSDKPNATQSKQLTYYVVDMVFNNRYIYIKYVEHLIIYYYLENKTNFYRSTIDYKSLNDEILALRYDQKLLLMQ